MLFEFPRAGEGAEALLAGVRAGPGALPVGGGEAVGVAVVVLLAQHIHNKQYIHTVLILIMLFVQKKIKNCP